MIAARQLCSATSLELAPDLTQALAAARASRQSAFLTPLVTRWRGEKRVVAAPLLFYCGPIDSLVEVPAGFEYDGESVPRYFPVLYAAFANRCEEAAAVHDFGYSALSTLTREEADTCYLEAMRVTMTEPPRETLWQRISAPVVKGYRISSRNIKWAGVRTFGGRHYQGAALASKPDVQQPLDPSPGG